jgi:hypothetical protein
MKALGYIKSESVESFYSHTKAPPAFDKYSRDEMCTLLTSSDFLDLKADEHTVFVAVAITSIVMSITVFLTTIWNSKLNQHPYSLVAGISLIDAMFFILFITLEHICTFNLDKLFSLTVYFSTTEDDFKRALWVLYVSGVYWFLFATILSFALNSALCLDLYLTVKNPFVSGNGRTKLYILMGIGLAIILTSWEIIKVLSRGTFDTE